MTDVKSIECDVCVIGSGLAGMATALFAAARGLSVAQVGHTGEIIFASGLLDLLSVYPVREKRMWRDPWAAIDKMIGDMNEHPFVHIKKSDIKAAFDEILDILKEAGLPYQRRINRNSDILTAMGTIKRTYAVPHTMWNGVLALEKKPACMIIGIRGLKGFSARQITAALQPGWPNLRAASVSFPDMDQFSEVYTERMANALLLPRNREKFAQIIRPLIKKSKFAGLPAILGLHRTVEIISHIEELVDVPLFEIPTMPPSVPGLRLKEAFERSLRRRNVQYFATNRALKVLPAAEGHFETQIGQNQIEHTVYTKGIILASGRFIGGGLHADRQHIRESIFNLPVYQPANRADWHRRDLLDPRGHLINRAGLKIDRTFRPVDDSGHPVFETLFAAGSILAHNDWKRLKCGAGVAIASAYAAVKAFMKI